MNDTLARLDYEEWCRRNRKRKTEAGWELWREAYKAGARSIGIDPRLFALPAKNRAFILNLIESAIDTLGTT